MKERSTITCKKCGVTHYMALDGKEQMMPVFCCGSELRKSEEIITSSKTLKNPVRKKK